MHFRLEQRFQSPLATVEAAFLDPALIAYQSGMPELGHPQLLEVAADGDTIRQQIRYRFTGVLSPAMGMVLDSDRLTWVEDSEFDCRTNHQQFQILPEHYPDLLRCSGTVILEEADGETARVAEGDLDVQFPLVGGAVARTILRSLVEHAANQERVVAAWLSRRDERT